jgi:hypothetical protein
MLLVPLLLLLDQFRRLWALQHDAAAGLVAYAVPLSQAGAPRDSCDNVNVDSLCSNDDSHQLHCQHRQQGRQRHDTKTLKGVACKELWGQAISGGCGGERGDCPEGGDINTMLLSAEKAAYAYVSLSPTHGYTH